MYWSFILLLGEMRIFVIARNIYDFWLLKFCYYFLWGFVALVQKRIISINHFEFQKRLLAFSCRWQQLIDSFMSKTSDGSSFFGVLIGDRWCFSTVLIPLGILLWLFVWYVVVVWIFFKPFLLSFVCLMHFCC